MKNIYDVIKESLLDDEPVSDQSLYDNLLAGSEWRVDTDKKIIYFCPNEAFNQMSDRQLYMYNNPNPKHILSKLIKLMKMGFKMQPLSYITLENDPLDFKDINVISTCVLNIRTSVSKIDLSKFNIPIHSSIYIKQFEDFNNVTELKPYKGHVPNVMIETKTPKIDGDKYSIIKDWDCDRLYIQADFVYGGYLDLQSDGRERINGFYLDKLQEVVDNNPKATEIYLIDTFAPRQTYWKLSLGKKGSKRVVKNVVNKNSGRLKQEMYHLEYIHQQEYVWGWEVDYKKIYR